MKKTAAVLLILILIFTSFAFVIARAEETGTDTEEQDVSAGSETDPDTDEEPETDPHVHELVPVEGTPATCTQPGTVFHYVCNCCGKLFFDEDGQNEVDDENALVIEPTGHNFGEWETVVMPGAVTPGTERRICENRPEEDVILTVTLDAGHGKYDNKGVIDGFYEGRMSFALMSYLKEELERYSGVVVYTTRQKMEDSPALPERGKMAAENGSDLFISIHSNWFSNETACGVSVYRSFIRPESEELGSRLGLAVTKVINDVTGTTYMRNEGMPMTRIEKAYDETCGDGVNQDYYNVTRASVKSDKCRYSYIIEHGFHSNPAECRFLMDDENLKKLAYAESRVIAVYFGLYIRDGEELNVRHAEYREIPPCGDDELPYVYDIPDGLSADASKALPGGSTVRITEFDIKEFENAVPDKNIISVFEFDTSIFLWDIKPNGKITVTFPYPEDKDDDIIGASFIDGETVKRTAVYENDEAGEASVELRENGVYILFLYNRSKIGSDMNGDGSADNKDVVALFRSVSGEDVFIEELAADVDEDGEMGNKDVFMLFRSLSDITAE